MISDSQEVCQCPDLTPYWQLGQVDEAGTVVLQSLTTPHHYPFSPAEGLALRYFTGRYTPEQVQQACERQGNREIPPDLVKQLLEKLQHLGIVSTQAPEIVESRSPIEPGPRLKSGVEWIHHPEGYWILRNPIDVTFLQVSNADYRILSQVGHYSPSELTQRLNVTSDHVNRLLKLLVATGMLEGTTPMSPPKQRWTPLSLLFFRIPLFNPDPWLSRVVGGLTWIWTTPVAVGLTGLLVSSALVGLSLSHQIIGMGITVWMTQGGTILLPFLLLCGLVVALHELAHALTLKQYGGIVPEIGLLVICLSPGCYTNTTDSY